MSLKDFFKKEPTYPQRAASESEKRISSIGMKRVYAGPPANKKIEPAMRALYAAPEIQDRPKVQKPDIIATVYAGPPIMNSEPRFPMPNANGGERKLINPFTSNESATPNPTNTDSAIKEAPVSSDGERVCCPECKTMVPNNKFCNECGALLKKPM